MLKSSWTRILYVRISFSTWIKIVCSEWLPEAMGITKCSFYSIEMHRQAFTAATFSWCLFVGLSTFSFAWAEIRWLSFLWETLGLLSILSFGLSFMFTVNQCLLSFAAFALIGAESIGLYTSHLILLLLSAGSSYHNIACTVVDRWHGVLWITIYFSRPKNLSPPIILIQLNLGFICPKNFSQNCADSFTDFLTN